MPGWARARARARVMVRVRVRSRARARARDKDRDRVRGAGQCRVVVRHSVRPAEGVVHILLIRLGLG